MMSTVLAIALFVRTAYLLSIRHAFFFEHLVTEPQRYDAWAMDIVRGLAPARPPFDEGPAYPYFVALVYSIAGHNRFAVVALQALLDATSCAALATIASRAAPKSPRVGWIAGVLAALFGPMIYFTGQLEPATLAVFAVTLAILATPTTAKATPRAWLWAGAAWALALLVRSEIVLGLPVVLAHAWLLGRRVALWRASVAPAVLLAGSLAINAASSGHAMLLTTGSGVNLWIGNNESADGTNPFVEGPMEATAREIESKTSDAVVADAMFRERALSAMERSKGRAAGLLVRKFVWLWTDRELPNAIDIEWQEKQSFLFALPFSLLRLPLGFGVVFTLACAGVVLARRRLRSLVVLFTPVAIAACVAIAFFTNARFRLVLAPSLVVFAALAVDGAWNLRMSPKKLLAPAVAAAFAALISFGDWYGVREHRLTAIDENTRALENAAKQRR
jgi:4-amino-4-deoxy-L-arabinose transferase-like glycosyltransferase